MSESVNEVPQRATGDETVDAYEARGWKRESCVHCIGGVVSLYSMYDFEGPGECMACGGSGIVWCSPKGRYAEYPGGRFI